MTKTEAAKRIASKIVTEAINDNYNKPGMEMFDQIEREVAIALANAMATGAVFLVNE